jgi:ATP-dependent DNA helicase RecG
MDLFEEISDTPAKSEQMAVVSEHLTSSSEHLISSSEHLDGNSEHLDFEKENKLLLLATPVREKGKVSKDLMESTILILCQEDWLSLRTLARLLNREPDSLRNHYINAMLLDGRLEARVPGKRNHPNQAYRRKSHQ